MTTVHTGRHFLQIPGPTNIPDRVLRAMDMPALDHRGPVPVSRLPAKAVLVHHPHGQHDMGMGFGHSVFGHVPMHIEIGDHALIDEFAPNEVTSEFDAVTLTHLAWDGEFDFAGELGIPADLERFDLVPQLFAVTPCLRRILG